MLSPKIYCSVGSQRYSTARANGPAEISPGGQFGGMSAGAAAAKRSINGPVARGGPGAVGLKDGAGPKGGSGSIHMRSGANSGPSKQLPQKQDRAKVTVAAGSG